MRRARLRLRRFASGFIIMVLILHVFAIIGIIFEIPTNTEAEVGWSPKVRLSEWGNGSVNPQIVAWDNNVHVVWADNKTGNYEIYYRRSLDSGASWDPETRLTFTSENQTNPKIAVWENDVHVAWNKGYINSSDNGLTWGTSYNPFVGMEIGDLDIGVYQNEVYLAVDNYSFHYSPNPPVDEFWKYLLFKEISWPDWEILDTITDWWPYFKEIGMAVKNNEIHIIYGLGHHVLLDNINHTYSVAGGQPGSWSTPEEVVDASTDELQGLSTSYDGDLIRIAWDFHGYPAEDEGIYTKTWNGTWSDSTFLDGPSWSYTSTSGYYITWDMGDGDGLYSSEDGLILTSSGHPIGELWHDVFLENGSIHLVYIDEYEIYYMCKSNWPELEISSILHFDPPSPVYNGTIVTINATVSNTGASVQNMEVKFYNNDPDTDNDWVPDVTAEIIGNDTIDIDEGSSATASIDWIPPNEGFFLIYVWVDPDNLVIECDDTNNWKGSGHRTP